MKHTEQTTRDEDILNLCKQVLNITPNTYYNPDGADSSTCPFCGEELHYADADINKIEHSSDCAYLIAKDLTTGLL